MELAQVCFQLEAAFSLILQRALESELPHRVNPALRQRDSLFVYFPIQTHRDFCETGNSLSVSPSAVADCPHLLEREEGKQVQLLKPDGSCDGRSFGRKVWLWVLEASTGDPSVAPTLSITHSLKQLRYFQYKEYRLAGFFLGFLYEVINHCIPLPSFH